VSNYTKGPESKDECIIWVYYLRGCALSGLKTCDAQAIEVFRTQVLPLEAAVKHLPEYQIIPHSYVELAEIMLRQNLIPEAEATFHGNSCQ
jgi:hypothetical protein